MDGKKSPKSKKKTPRRPVENILQRRLLNPPSGPSPYDGIRKILPFERPHKRVCDELEKPKGRVADTVEPLAGFANNQERRARTFSEDIPHYDLIDYLTAEDKAVKSIESASSVIEQTKLTSTHVARTRSMISTEADVSSSRKTVPPTTCDLKILMKMLRDNEEIGFHYYLVYAVPRSSEYYHPYCFKVVLYHEVDKNNYLTISKHGVTYHQHREMQFTSLDRWERDYDFYLRLIKIKTFAKFSLWKCFYVWYKNIAWWKFHQAYNSLAELLFILDPVLQTALLKIQELSFKLTSTTLIDLTANENIPLEEFVNTQMEKKNMVYEQLLEFREIVKEIIYGACLGALLAVGFTPDDSNMRVPSELIGTLAMRGIKTTRDGRYRMSYTDQANKRRACGRLSRFIMLCDMIVQSLFHLIIKNSIGDFHSIISKHYQHLPTLETLDNDNLLTTFETPRTTPPKLPLFICTLHANEAAIFLVPKRNAFINAAEQIMIMWTEAILAIRIFASDQIFNPFTQPTVCDKQEERLIGYGVSLEFLLSSDVETHEIEKQIIEYIMLNFDVVKFYIKRFEPIHENFQKNEEMDRKIIKHERAIETFRGYLIAYHNEKEILKNIVSEQPLGIIYLLLEEFKSTIIPSPIKLLDLVEETLPRLGKALVDSLIAEGQDSHAYLVIEPRSTLNYVEYLNFLEKIVARVEQMDNELEYCKELYDLIEEFGVPCASEDVANYYGFSDILTNLHNTVERVVQDREKIIQKFNEQINKDIGLLLEEVGQIRDESLQPWLINIDSDPEEAKQFIANLVEQLTECQKKASQYRTYQKQFKVEVTRFEMLDEVMNDVKLRQLLWDSIEIWEKNVQDWTHNDFSTLNPDDMNQTTAKFMKHIAQFEKGLPENKIVPKLKESVELMKDKLPVITTLRNQNMKARHWMKVEEVLNHKFLPTETKTLKLLEDVGAFLLPTELQEISGQASSEASLEALLRKVEDAWKSLEFTVLPHRDAKDVYILAGLEEVQTVLDESNINVSTIASSRHVGPIKARVDDWMAKLDLFSRTLEEWITCQTDWLYLESIFSAPDIQRQLPMESKLFMSVDKSWKEIMRRVAKNPLAMPACTYPGLLETFQNSNNLLDQIMKCLEAYLETKRVVFPRFYFLSNDELIEILAQTRNPHAVQPHLRKCFDAISKLEFAVKQTDEKEEKKEGDKVKDRRETEVLTTDIVAMISPENEKVYLGKGLKARGNVEDWLGKVEEAMFFQLHKQMKASLMDYKKRPRTEWVLLHPSQIILTVSQTMWCVDVHEVFSNDTPEKVNAALENFEKKCFKDLNDSAAMVRGDMVKLKRMILCSLITIDVHARDIITSMVQNKVQSSENFEWLKQLRYYWETDIDNCVAYMSNARYLYGFEYLGASPRLVITPLTDKCYLCLMGALQLDLGGAPAGPAGTGKTETTKDLAKSLAVQCVVFNCSEGLDFKMMGRFFSGLAQSGAWCCFDEFNRIDIEVLSVIAQQLITIRNAKVAKASKFMFEGREIKLVMTCAAFITMNPGYAGRTELPDNLKSLFRPMAMMVPDYGLIAEVILYSEGFESSKALAKKMVNMYKLCSEQLSQQDHYDFGMRAVKSVLVMAGSLKRENPNISEDIVLIRALRDSNLPKFLLDDAVLFQGILNDLFPGIVLPEPDYGSLQEAITSIIASMLLQPEPCTSVKVIQLLETMIVRHGVMTVGPTGGGKTTVLNILKGALAKLHSDGVIGPYYRPVQSYTINPKSVTMGELYGEVNLMTLEWKDGLLGIFVRLAVKCTEEIHQWVVCDGPVDAVWIENMNTVLDDNKMLCLANSERIKLTPWVHMLFEVQDLAQASPATVSRCGMVYIDPDDLKWMPYVKTWLKKLTDTFPIANDYKVFIIDIFQLFVENGLTFIKKNCQYAIHQVDISKISMLCSLMESLLTEPGVWDKNMDKSRLKTMICHVFAFSYTWALGGNLTDLSQEKFDMYVREQFEEYPDAHIPPASDFWLIYFNTKERQLEPWVRILPQFKYNPDTPFFEMLVPTIDTVRFGYIMERLLSINHPVMYTGTTGVGKSVVAKTVLNRLQESGKWVPVTLNFSAQTSSLRTQEILESKLEKKKKTLLGAPSGKKVVVFVDDVNMPKLETYGAQPPVELLRQFLDFGGLYDREKLFWKEINDVVICAACAPPGGGRNPLTPRFVRHFGLLLIPSPSESTLKVIFRAIMKGFLSDFSRQISDVAESLVNAAIEIYQRISVDLLPTPAKSHYVFNLRDLSKCIQGILQADSSSIREAQDIYRLFYHECLRVFHDRLINLEDKSYFFRLMHEICQKSFGSPVLMLPAGDDVIKDPPLLLFGDFLKPVAKEDRIYEEIKDVDKLRLVLQEVLMDYSLVTSKEMKLILFLDAIEHAIRVSRILRAERGNGLLVGVGGMGKQNITRLASHVNTYKCFQIELTRTYDYNSFHDDLRKLYYNAGALKEDTVFLFVDTQIVVEEFLEDINNILNSGEVPNLFEADEFEKVVCACRPAAKEAGISESNRDGIFDFFISRVRSKLHLVITMSPVGDAFRRRCRMFPSLVNCCTIDWFLPWPEEALLSVAEDSLQPLENKELIYSMTGMCFMMHNSVEKMTERFYREMRRRYYVTPTSYLELLKLYLSLLSKKQEEKKKVKDRIQNGLTKLLETNVLVASMKIELTEMEPKLKEKSEDTKKLMTFLVKEKAQADEVRKVVAKEEAIVKEKAAETQSLADDAQKDLDMALPAMEAASKALEALNKTDINELRVFNKPPNLVKFVMEAVCLLLGSKVDWQSAKQVLGDINFLKKLQDYDKDHIPDSLLKKLKDYVDHPEFMPDLVATQSKVCKSICMWVRAIDTYAKVYRVVEPKRKKVEGAEKELAAVMAILRQKQQMLADVEAQIAKLEAQYDASVAEKAELEAKMDQCSARLNRAGRLTMALGDEQIRWAQTVKTITEEMYHLTGDVLIAAGCIAYLGAFTSVYREELIGIWIEMLKELKIPSSSTFSLIKILADAYEIRMWNSFGLPRDNISTENAILVTQAGRWPLMIDPQEQANRWIRNMEHDKDLKVIKLTDSNFLRILETAIRIGCPVLLEEVGEKLDPTLGPVLLKQIFVQGGRAMIRLGDSDIEYDNNFRLYVTTKLANPHYLPEICIQVTLVNFTVTPTGVEDQLLADVVRLERPDLEKQRNELIMRINNDKGQLKSIEDKILKLLFTSQGNILDDEELIETLNESKETSTIIASRLMEAEETEEKITLAREKYRSVAVRGSCLYFVVSQLADVDPMYQFSLKYFNLIFNSVIETSKKSTDLGERLKILLDEITLAIYTNVSRGLFERHKLVFSFMLCASIYRQSGEITDGQWNFLIRGPMGSKVGIPKKPEIGTLTEAQWFSVHFLASNFPLFHELPGSLTTKITLYFSDLEEVINFNPQNEIVCPIDWNKNLKLFEKMMVLRALKEERLVFAITEYVRELMGQPFVESPLISLSNIFKDTSNITPLVFVLSTGSDPVGAFQRFAADSGNSDKIQSISLGQGQGPIAEVMIKAGVKRGDWVFLQNCHLASSWMLAMERQIIGLIQNPKDIHNDFRLFLSSMPTSSFPVSVLQNSVKVTNEPPKGLRSNIKRALLDITEDYFHDHPLQVKWRKMIFGICFFHGVIQERKKFGPLGWNILYEFNDSDRECALLNLQLFCNDDEIIPWDALEYTTGEITYGGRVTDYWDQRTLKTILKGFFSPVILESDYKYSESGIYFCPESTECNTLKAYREFVEKLPIIEEPEIFGMNSNANIAFQTKETASVINTIMDVQPKESTGVEGKSSDEIVFELAEQIRERIIKTINEDDTHPQLVKRDSKGRLPSLTTVLKQEVDRFNGLLSVLHSSLNDLKKAIRGFIVMNDALEGMYTSFMNQQVPQMWAKKAYPSLKSLGSWVRDLELRLDFIYTWMQWGPPPSYWLSGFFFPQGFMTGSLQTHARKYNFPIDQLIVDFTVLKVTLNQEEIEEHHKAAQKEVEAAYGNVEVPVDGLLVHGLFIDAGRFDTEKGVLADANPGELNPPLPVMHLIPVTELVDVDKRYTCPLYKTAFRAGVLSTTGHSTNFVVPVLLPTDKSQDYWILRGTALLTAVTD